MKQVIDPSKQCDDFIALYTEFYVLPEKLQSQMKNAFDISCQEMMMFDDLEPTSAFKQSGHDILPKDISDDDWNTYMKLSQLAIVFPPAFALLGQERYTGDNCLDNYKTA